LIKILWHDGIGLSHAERLDKGRLIWPWVVNGAVLITAAEMGYMLEVIDWRNPSTPRARPDKAYGHLTQAPQRGATKAGRRVCARGDPRLAHRRAQHLSASLPR
jgi:transposase